MHSAWEGSEPWEDDYGRECYDCGVHDDEMACVREDLKDLISVLYAGGDMDLDRIDRCIEQLCDRVGMLCPTAELEEIYVKKEMTA